MTHDVTVTCDTIITTSHNHYHANLTYGKFFIF